MKPSHAGGVVYGINDTGVEYLLVGPSREKANEWLLPKGHIREGETPEKAAIREVLEETGAAARLICPIDTVEFKVGDTTLRANFYLMERVSQGDALEKRRRGWFSYQEALRKATHPETRRLLEAAEAKRRLLAC